MTAIIKPGWSKPSTILFASELPINEKAFASVLAQAAESGAELIILHAHDSLDATTSVTAGLRHYDYAAACAEKHCLEPLVQRAGDVGIRCTIALREGLAADQILTFSRERKIDRIVMGAHSPGPLGKLLVGSVAEAVLRNANVPVCIVGPLVVERSYRTCTTRKILCDVSTEETSRVVANFGAELAFRNKASLILQQVIQPQERAEVLASRTIGQIEAELPSLVPSALQHNISVQTRVALGDRTEELLNQGRVQKANCIVLGAQGASHFAAITRAGTVYKVLAYAHCPVVTLSPIVLAECGAREYKPRPSEVNYMAGVF
jgi:nucleotide-binding universal stress UspA family protein